MTPEDIIKRLAVLIEYNPEARVGHLTISPIITLMAHDLTYCINCGREYKDSHYCLTCGHIKGKGGAY